MGASLHLVQEGGPELRSVLKEQMARGEVPAIVLLEGADEGAVPDGLETQRLDPVGSVDHARRLLELVLSASNTAVW